MLGFMQSTELTETRDSRRLFLNSHLPGPYEHHDFAACPLEIDSTVHWETSMLFKQMTNLIGLHSPNSVTHICCLHFISNHIGPMCYCVFKAQCYFKGMVPPCRLSRLLAFRSNAIGLFLIECDSLPYGTSQKQD